MWKCNIADTDIKKTETTNVAEKQVVIEKLYREETITAEDMEYLLTTDNQALLQSLYKNARKAADEIYGKSIYIRGLIEFTNYCRNNCYYCGIRRDNRKADRYRLSADEILQCAEEGYRLGLRTFVMQGGEDSHYSDRDICEIVSGIKEKYPDCAVTLSIGEKSYKSYKAYFDAGADRYLLRHETANEIHYRKLHPGEMSLENRKRCLYDLKAIGYQTGCGFMAGSPYQTMENIYEDLMFIKQFKPHMVGIGPFIPMCDTPFAKKSQGTLEMTIRLLAIVRLMNKRVLLPATTALATIHEHGRELGIMAGANVVMPNLSPKAAREKYKLYDKKKNTGTEAAEGLEELKRQMASVGYTVVTDRGDYR